MPGAAIGWRSSPGGRTRVSGPPPGASGGRGTNQQAHQHKAVESDHVVRQA